VVDYLKQMLRPVAAGMIMYAVVVFFQQHVFGSVGDWLYLIQLVMLGALSYAGAMLVIDRQGLQETLELIRR
jgi:hypothetical protein